MSEDLTVTEVDAGMTVSDEVKDVKAGEGGDQEVDYQKVEFYIQIEKGNSLPYKFRIIKCPQFYEDWLLVKAWIDREMTAKAGVAMRPKEEKKVQIATPGMMTSLKQNPNMRKKFFR